MPAMYTHINTHTHSHPPSRCKSGQTGYISLRCLNTWISNELFVSKMTAARLGVRGRREVILDRRLLKEKEI